MEHAIKHEACAKRGADVHKIAPAAKRGKAFNKACGTMCGFRVSPSRRVTVYKHDCWQCNGEPRARTTTRDIYMYIHVYIYVYTFTVVDMFFRNENYLFFKCCRV